MFKTITLVKSVDSILSAFTKTITELEAHSEAQTKTISVNAEAIRRLEEDSAKREMERSRANDASTKLKSLFN